MKERYETKVCGDWIMNLIEIKAVGGTTITYGMLREEKGPGDPSDMKINEALRKKQRPVFRNRKAYK